MSVFFLKGGDIISKLIAIQKSETEQIRMEVREYKGKKFIDIRIYYQDEDGEYKPTKKGITLSCKLYPELKEAIEELKETLD